MIPLSTQNDTTHLSLGSLEFCPLYLEDTFHLTFIQKVEGEMQ